MTAEEQVVEGELVADEEEKRDVVPVDDAPPRDLMGIIDRAMVDPRYDIDKLDRLLAMQERWQANEARRAFTRALAAFKAETLDIRKDQRADFETRSGGRMTYQHATLDKVTDVVVPALSRHGLSHHWTTTQADGKVTITCFLTHEDGHSESTEFVAPEDHTGQKNAIQAIGSAITYGQRYTLLAITGLAARGADDDGHTTSGNKPAPARGGGGQGRGRGRQQSQREEGPPPQSQEPPWMGAFVKAMEEAGISADDVRRYAAEAGVRDSHAARREWIGRMIFEADGDVLAAVARMINANETPPFVDAVRAQVEASPGVTELDLMEWATEVLRAPDGKEWNAISTELGRLTMAGQLSGWAEAIPVVVAAAVAWCAQRDPQEDEAIQQELGAQGSK